MIRILFEIKEFWFYVFNYIFSLLNYSFNKLKVQFQDYLDYLEIARFGYWHNVGLNNFNTSYKRAEAEAGFNFSNFRFKFSKVLTSFEPLINVRGYVWGRGSGVDSVEFRLIQNEYYLAAESIMPHSWYYNFKEVHSRFKLWYLADTIGAGLNIKQLNQVKRVSSSSFVWFVLMFTFLYIPFIFTEFIALSFYFFFIKLSKFISFNSNSLVVANNSNSFADLISYVWIFIVARLGYCFTPIIYFVKVFVVFMCFKVAVYRFLFLISYSTIQMRLFSIYEFFSCLSTIFFRPFHLFNFLTEFGSRFTYVYVCFKIGYLTFFRQVLRAKTLVTNRVFFFFSFITIWFFFNDIFHYFTNIITFYFFLFFYAISSIGHVFLYNIFDLRDIPVIFYLDFIFLGGLAFFIPIFYLFPFFKLSSFGLVDRWVKRFVIAFRVGGLPIPNTRGYERRKEALYQESVDLFEMQLLESFSASSYVSYDFSDTNIDSVGIPLEKKIFSSSSCYNSNYSSSTSRSMGAVIDSKAPVFGVSLTAAGLPVDNFSRYFDLSWRFNYRSFIKDIYTIFLYSSRTPDSCNGFTFFCDPTISSFKPVDRYYRVDKEITESSFTNSLLNQMYLSFSNVPGFEPFEFDLHQSIVRGFYFSFSHFNSSSVFSFFLYYFFNTVNAKSSIKSGVLPLDKFFGFYNNIYVKFASTFYFFKISRFNLVVRDGFFYDSTITQSPGVYFDDNVPLQNFGLKGRSSWFLEDLVASNLRSFRSLNRYTFGEFDLSTWFCDKSSFKGLDLYARFKGGSVGEYWKVGLLEQVRKDFDQFLNLNFVFYFSYTFSVADFVDSFKWFFYPFWIFRNASVTSNFFNISYADIFSNVVNHSILFSYGSSGSFYEFFPKLGTVVANSSCVTLDFWNSLHTIYDYSYRSNWAFSSDDGIGLRASKLSSNYKIYGGFKENNFSSRFYSFVRSHIRGAARTSMLKGFHRYGFFSTLLFLPHYFYARRWSLIGRKAWFKLGFFKRFKFRVILRVKRAVLQLFYFWLPNDVGFAAPIISSKYSSFGVFDICLIYYFMLQRFGIVPYSFFYKFFKMFFLWFIFVGFPYLVLGFEFSLFNSKFVSKYYDNKWIDQEAGYSKDDYIETYWLGLRIQVHIPGVADVPSVKGVVEEYNQKLK